jgi:hypothetical protein
MHGWDGGARLIVELEVVAAALGVMPADREAGTAATSGCVWGTNGVAVLRARWELSSTGCNVVFVSAVAVSWFVNGSA